MAKPFYERLVGYYRAIGKVLRGEADAASVFPNTTDIGMSRERAYMRFLEAHVPSSCGVTLGGFLFGLDGSESRQLDIIVSAGVAPRFDFHTTQPGGKAFACIDGAIAVASVKSKLSSAELVDALDNIASLPKGQDLTNRVMSLMNIPNLDDIPYKIIFATDGVEVSTALQTIEEYYAQHPETPQSRRPNIIHVAGKYVIIRVGSLGGKTRDGTKIPPGIFYALPDLSDAYALGTVAKEIQRNAHATSNIIYDFEPILLNLPI